MIKELIHIDPSNLPNQQPELYALYGQKEKVDSLGSNTAGPNRSISSPIANSSS